MDHVQGKFIHACKKCAKEALVMVLSSDRYPAVRKGPITSSNCHEHVRKLHDVWNILQTGVIITYKLTWITSWFLGHLSIFSKQAKQLCHRPHEFPLPQEFRFQQVKVVVEISSNSSHLWSQLWDDATNISSRWPLQKWICLFCMNCGILADQFMKIWWYLVKQTNENDRTRNKSTGQYGYILMQKEFSLSIHMRACARVSKLSRTTSQFSVKHARTSAVGSGLQDLK